MNWWRSQSLLRISLLLLPLGGCGWSEVTGDVEPVPWWVLVLGGLLIIAFTLWISASKDTPNSDTEMSGPPGFPEELVPLALVLFGIVMCLVGVIGAFYPPLLVWVGAYSKAVETTETAGHLIWFLIISVVVTAAGVGYLIRGLVRLAKREGGRNDQLAVLVWPALFLLYYGWVHFTDRWHELFGKPLADFFTMIIGA